VEQSTVEAARRDRVSGTELVAAAGGALLAVSVFLPWYQTDPGNRNALLDGARGSFSAWEAHPILRWLLLAAAAAPFILAYIIARGHQLSWARGELTAVVAIAAFGLIVFNGLASRPGDPASAVSLRYGWYLAVLGTLLMLGGSAKRSSEVERPRKPPGVI
jgi:hypothetical protein